MDSLIRPGACDEAAGTLVTAIGSPCLPPHDNSALVVLVVLELVHAAVLVEDDQLDRHLLRVVPSNLVRLCRRNPNRNRRVQRENKTHNTTRHQAKRAHPTPLDGHTSVKEVQEARHGSLRRVRHHWEKRASEELGGHHGEHQNRGGGRVHEEGEGTAAEMSSASGFWSSKWMRG